MKEPTELVRGVAFFDGCLGRDKQQEILEDIRSVVGMAPLYAPMTPYGKPMSVRMTSAGQFGWFSDRKGYRYVPQHPNGTAWPDIPESVLNVWRDLVPDAPDPECCLINFYEPKARMGLHQDRDEANFDWPVVSISIGDDALFRMGGVERGGSTCSRWIRSGDVCVMGGDARLIYHGIDRIKPGTSNILNAPGRINLTLRVVT